MSVPNDAMAATVVAPDLAAIKTRQQATWASGDYGMIGVTLQIVAESLCEATDVRADERVLDVAAGNGNATLAAARRFANVTSTDYVANLLGQGQRRAEAERLSVRFEVADVEKLPYADASFDVVLSTFGAMFAPDQSRTASEIMRVARSGGRIALANWTPEGFIGDLFRLLAVYVKPPAGLDSPMLWGTEKRLDQLFGAAAREIRCTRRDFMFRYRSAEHWIEIFRRYYGPTHKAFAALAPDRQGALHVALIELLSKHNRARGEGTLVVPGEYLEIVIVKA
ncbi:MAG TPA: class I SAM-dependent methyltransferase [Casimicrobiaceae bacterium]|nr:class I SAM-dependent methyltransferase [Casimicrobiaceae bacterium]